MGRTGRRNTRYKTKSMKRGFDQIHEETKPDKLETTLEKATVPDEEKPGLGQYFCPFCHKYFISAAAKVSHEKSAPHKRALKRLLEDPHNQYDADWAIQNLLKKLSQRNPLVTYEVLGQTHEGRDLFAIEITKNKSLPVIWVDGGIHAREWISPSSLLYLIDHLVSTSSSKSYLDKYQFILIPVLNPDGYVYSHKYDRYWRKNRSRPKSTCVGVDVNRNFPAFWLPTDGEGCPDSYSGPSAASELETQAMIKYSKNLVSTRNVQAFLTIHAYGQLLMLCYGNKKLSYPKNYNDLAVLALMMKNDLIQNQNASYSVGNIVDLLYEAGGGSTDYSTIDLQIPVNFAIELADTGQYGFIMPASFIIPVGKHVVQMVETLVREMKPTKI
ncbi:hypothetical protein Ciccas_001482 [Cichlidogyrus casuarinus]|uniref:Uncharacterized protein n=1 Tax=Cichlidogyrus casuarinus TaxID=1844966 RepID=A0ABD2QJX1_9PLAT